jgi:hypothetical protein
MYSLRNGILRRVTREGILPDDLIVFCFGEIDVRCHIHKFKDQGIQNIVDDLVTHYFLAVQEAMNHFPETKVGIYFVPPATKKENIVDNPDFPWLGEDSERLNYTRTLNKTLGERCEEEGYLFIDLTEWYEDDEGFLRLDMAEKDGPHIQDASPLVNFLQRLIKEDE